MRPKKKDTSPIIHSVLFSFIIVTHINITVNYFLRTKKGNEVKYRCLFYNRFSENFFEKRHCRKVVISDSNAVRKLFTAIAPSNKLFSIMLFSYFITCSLLRNAETLFSKQRVIIEV